MLQVIRFFLCVLDRLQQFLLVTLWKTVYYSRMSHFIIIIIAAISESVVYDTRCDQACVSVYVFLTNIQLAVKLQFRVSLWGAESDLPVLSIKLQHRLFNVLLSLHAMPLVVVQWHRRADAELHPLTAHVEREYDHRASWEHHRENISNILRFSLS